MHLELLEADLRVTVEVDALLAEALASVLGFRGKSRSTIETKRKENETSKSPACMPQGEVSENGTVLFFLLLIWGFKW